MEAGAGVVLLDDVAEQHGRPAVGVAEGERLLHAHAPLEPEQPQQPAQGEHEEEGVRPLRTGDRGYFREDGNLLLTGRTKELFKSRGELVSPKEIEEVITTHPAVREAYVIGMPDDRDGECGCAWLVAAGPIPPSVAEVNDFLSSRLPRFKMPRNIWFIDPAELPKTGTGKVQKNLLKDRAERLLAAGAAA